MFYIIIFTVGLIVGIVLGGLLFIWATKDLNKPPRGYKFN